MIDKNEIESKALVILEKFVGHKLPDTYDTLKLRQDLNVSSLDLIIIASEIEEITGVEVDLQDLITHYATTDNPVIEDLTVNQVMEYLKR